METLPETVITAQTRQSRFPSLEQHDYNWLGEVSGVERVESVSLDELFPNGKPDEESLRILRLASGLGVPFPVEKKEGYATWWRLLHDIGHWAVKPDAFNALFLNMFKVPVKYGPVAGIDGPPLWVAAYPAGNDVIPDAAFFRDPTLGELEVRAWFALTVEALGLRDSMPFPDKPANARIFSPVSASPEALHKLHRYGIDFERGDLRSESTLVVPYLNPRSGQEVIANFRAIREWVVDHGGDVTHLTRQQRILWEDYLTHRFNSLPTN